MNPTDFKVLYGELRQFAAYFDDRGRAEKFARDHHSDTIIPLVAVIANASSQSILPADPQPSADTA